MADIQIGLCIRAWIERPTRGALARQAIERRLAAALARCESAKDNVVRSSSWRYVFAVALGTQTIMAPGARAGANPPWCA